MLVACEFSGVVREAFRCHGHDAWSCDLLPSEIPGPHFQCNVLTILDQGWDLMVAHPPCTYLCNSGVRHLHGEKGQERYRLMFAACQFFQALWRCSIPRIAIENPIPHKYARAELGDYTQLIQPWMFGHGETKATCLWLKNLPLLEPSHRRQDLFCLPEPKEREHRIWLMSPNKDRAKNRSRTFIGIAAAMAQQWGEL